MSCVATLIGSIETVLTDTHIAALETLLPPARKAVLAPQEAFDFFYDSDAASVRAALEPWAISNTLDVIVQGTANRRKKALLADMESTIIQQEMLDELAVHAGKEAEVKEITRRAMNGELDFHAALAERLAMLKGTPKTLIDELGGKITYMSGASELVGTMRAHGAECVLVSGGFTCYTEPVKQKLGFHHHFGNTLHIENNAVAGIVVEPVLDKSSKLKTLEETAARLAIPAALIVAVGDGANDVPMLKAAGLGVAFHGKPAVQQQVEHNIRFAGLRALLWAQGYTADDLRA
jgi:phosphoserine phosphatase